MPGGPTADRGQDEELVEGFADLCAARPVKIRREFRVPVVLGLVAGRGRRVKLPMQRGHGRKGPGTGGHGTSLGWSKKSISRLPLQYWWDLHWTTPWMVQMRSWIGATCFSVSSETPGRCMGLLTAGGLWDVEGVT